MRKKPVLVCVTSFTNGPKKTVGSFGENNQFFCVSGLDPCAGLKILAVERFFEMSAAGKTG